MGLFDHKKADGKFDSGVVLGRSGVVPAIGDRERRSDSIPKMWDDELDDQETTGETNHVPASRRVNAFPHLMIMTGLGAGRLVPIDRSLVVGRSRKG